MAEWNTYRPTARVYARQFDPTEEWPKCIHPWPDKDGKQPRDGSYGYIVSHGGQRMHVRAGDYIMRGVIPDVFFVVSPEGFEETYEYLEDEDPPDVVQMELVARG